VTPYGFWQEFRWFWWRRWDRFETFYICFFRFFHRVWRYRRILARDYDFDWVPMAQLMELKLRAMADCLEHNYHVNGKRDARQCRVAASLCRRLIDDNYADMHGTRWDQVWAKRVQTSTDGDCRYLGLLIGKYMRHWWS
jgi:hypothetical protein